MRVDRATDAIMFGDWAAPQRAVLGCVADHYQLNLASSLNALQRTLLVFNPLLASSLLELVLVSAAPPW